MNRPRQRRPRPQQPEAQPKKQPKKKDHRANRSLLRRIIVLMTLFGFLLFIPMAAQLWKLQILQYDEWTERAADNQTRDVSVSANRGSIYDASGHTLAVSATVYNLVMSPKDVVQQVNELAKKTKELQDESGDPDDAKVKAALEETRALIIDFLVDEFDLDEDRLRTSMEKTSSQYEVLVRELEDEETEPVKEFIEENKSLGMSAMISLVPTPKRYYAYSSVGSHLLGYMGYTEDSGDQKVGRQGLERRYNDELTGKRGRMVTARTGANFRMLSNYENFYDAENGGSLTLTMDVSVQALAEQMLQEGIESYDVQEGGFVIAMNPQTGGIYAMASSPDFDPNNYSAILDSLLLDGLEETAEEYGEDSDEYGDAVTAARNKQWRNKAVSDTYEPGSTFKPLTVAAALEEGVISMSDTFYCSGATEIGGHLIHCHKRGGHKLQTLTEVLENSCNCGLMEIAQRLGAETFWDYLEDYGLFEKTGIDLGGEENSVFWSQGRDYFVSANGLSSLAVASFGQTFRVTPIQMITAFASVINGGHLLQPYLVEKISDSDGNTIYSHEVTEVRQVISETTSEKIRTMLESVVANGTGGNAYMAGYRIGGKTGTSEKIDQKDSNDVIVSFMGFAPADDPQVLVLVALDSPKKNGGSSYGPSGTYVSGGSMAAPIAGQLIASILDNMGIEKQYTADELSGKDTVVPSLAGLDLSGAEKKLSEKGLSCRTVGTGSVVTGQIPAGGLSVPGGSTVVLYMGEEVPTEQVEVPNLFGMSPAKVKEELESRGLFLRANGVSADYSSDVTASHQSLDPGVTVAPGTVVEVQFVSNVIDYAYNT